MENKFNYFLQEFLHNLIMYSKETPKDISIIVPNHLYKQIQSELIVEYISYSKSISKAEIENIKLKAINGININIVNNENNKYILGIYSSKVKNIETGQFEYLSNIEVSKDVIDWLEMHDKKINEFGDTVYIVNFIEYINLGFKFVKDEKIN